MDDITSISNVQERVTEKMRTTTEKSQSCYSCTRSVKGTFKKVKTVVDSALGEYPGGFRP